MKKETTLKTNKALKTKDSEKDKLSKIAQFMANRPGKGEIVNMRAVLR